MPRVFKNGKRSGRKCDIKPVYPAIVEWLDEQNMSYVDFHIMTGMSTAHLYHIIYGLVDPKKATIDKILKIMGAKYEDVFKSD